MLNLLAFDVSKIFIAIGVIMFVAVVIMLIRIIRRPSHNSDGNTSWNRKADELAQIMSADELYNLAKSHIEKTIPDADFILGEAIMHKAAEKGKAEAQLYVGKGCYFKNINETVEWYKKAAAQGLDEAYERLGDIYNYGRSDRNGHSVAADYNEAEKWYLPLAEKGNVEVMKLLGLLYTLHFKDEEKSMKWYIKAAETGDLEAIKRVALQFDIDGDSKNSIKWCKKAAEAGDLESMHDLAGLYEFAETPDMEQAVFWYEKAAENGYSYSKVKIALLYIDGKGVEKDEKKGLEMLQTEASNGNYHAKYHLGKIYKDGKTVGKDLKKAIEFFMQSQNFFASRFELGYMYLDGEGVEKDEKKGFEYLSQDNEIFDRDALFRLGECYYYGRGTEKDKEKARELWRKSAKYENEAAIEALDRLFGETVTNED